VLSDFRCSPDQVPASMKKRAKEVRTVSVPIIRNNARRSGHDPCLGVTRRLGDISFTWIASRLPTIWTNPNLRLPRTSYLESFRPAERLQDADDLAKWRIAPSNR
jgi:hypothetical protein